MLTLEQIGIVVRDAVLTLADLLRQEAAPGVVTLALIAILIVAVGIFTQRVLARRSAIVWLRSVIARYPDGRALSENISTVDLEVQRQARSGARRHVADAWAEYRETLVPHEENGELVLRNSGRPSAFFNAEDLHFSSGFWRIVPGLFVTVGLFLTFLGLISALHAMDLGADEVQDSLKALLTIASAKFIMSLTGLFCSIVFAIVLRWGMGRIESAVHGLCGAIERRLTFISLESLAEQQLASTREQREHFRLIGMELVAELGRPLREELPTAISTSISSAMAPLLQQLGTAGAEGMETMVKDLSSRFTDDVGRALAEASERLVEAGDRIGLLAERMDQSSGRMGGEIDGAVARLVQSLDDLKTTLASTATSRLLKKGLAARLLA